MCVCVSIYIYISLYIYMNLYIPISPKLRTCVCLLKAGLLRLKHAAVLARGEGLFRWFPTAGGGGCEGLGFEGLGFRDLGV